MYEKKWTCKKQIGSPGDNSSPRDTTSCLFEGVGLCWRCRTLMIVTDNSVTGWRLFVLNEKNKKYPYLRKLNKNVIKCMSITVLISMLNQPYQSTIYHVLLTGVSETLSAHFTAYRWQYKWQKNLSMWHNTSSNMIIKYKQHLSYNNSFEVRFFPGLLY